jgi:hypothetical protein
MTFRTHLLVATVALLGVRHARADEQTPAEGRATPRSKAKSSGSDCSFDMNKLSVSGDSVNLVATLENPPKTRVTLSITGYGGFHTELVWDPAVGDGLQHDVLLRSNPAVCQGKCPYTIMAFAEDDRLQTAQIVVVTSTQFTTSKKCAFPADPSKQPSGKETIDKSADPQGCVESTGTDEIVIRGSTLTRTVVAGSKEPDRAPRPPDAWTPGLRLKCNSGTIELSELRLNHKQLYAASVARGFLDQAAPAAVTDTLAVLAEIAVDRAKAGALELIRERFIDPICNRLNLRLLGLGGDEQAFPRACTLLSGMRLEDLLSSGRSLIEAVKDDVRLTLLPALVAKLDISSAARDIAALSLRLGNEMLDGSGNDGADLDLLVEQLDRSFLRGALASLESYKAEFIKDAIRLTPPGSHAQIIRDALQRALPDDPGVLIADYVKHNAAEAALVKALPLKDISACARQSTFPWSSSYRKADKPTCVNKITDQVADKDLEETLRSLGLRTDELIGILSTARRERGDSDFETWIAERIERLDQDAIVKIRKDVLASTQMLEGLRRSCAVRVALGVVKWCSRRDSCTASEIGTALDNPEALFASPHLEDSAELICWHDDAKDPTKKLLTLPKVRTQYIELAARAVAFLTPPAKTDARKRVHAILRWVFDLARSMEAGKTATSLQQLEEIVELLDKQDYVRAMSQVVTMAFRARGCPEARCEMPRELTMAMKLFGSVASYLRVYDDTKGLDAAEAKTARKKAIENLIDSATDRQSRGGDWIVSLGVPVGISAGRRWTPGTSASGYPSADFSDAFERERAFAWRIPLGLSLQRLPVEGAHVGFHAGITFADLGNFLRGSANDEADEIRWKDFLQIGGQVGFLFGGRKHSVLVAGDISWSPGLYEREVTINTAGVQEQKTLSGALMYGVTIAYYVPIFDLN